MAVRFLKAEEGDWNVTVRAMAVAEALGAVVRSSVGAGWWRSHG